MSKEDWQVSYDCSSCDWFEPLKNKDLEADFGFCTNPDCEAWYHVLFEHFRCKKAKDFD